MVTRFWCSSHVHALIPAISAPAAHSPFLARLRYLGPAQHRRPATIPFIVVGGLPWTF